ncbi:peptide chain release factor 2 [Shimazuella sp. AN120528]|uniref:peptide chain release factor 2 n=1 Tax=Shimazuella soli TaxID=1892854 RepID=UPI001F0FC9EB|nr:peptide chain release factor 2 [Shimazuella soli]MCH5585296.1 peptide chain release factor 2 [Shimazuella soli]
MDLQALKQEFHITAKRLADLRGSLDLEEQQSKLVSLEAEMAEETFWDDQQKAQQKIAQLREVKDIVEQVQQLTAQNDEIQVMMELLQEEEDPSLLSECEASLKTFQEQVNEFELQQLLSGPYDRNSAILELHPGAGGTESQDWAEMLLRMYTRWAEKSGYKIEMIDYLPGDEAGLKSVTLLIKGINAYGYLRTEKGIHRLVRISPFDASGRRHTSFASVNVVPELDDDVEIEIRTEDLKVDTYRASGAGGQHINTTDSAVRITHIPTGVVVTCQSERSQIKNRDKAMKVLKARLYEKKMEEQEQKLNEIKGEQTEIGWGNQIRSYVFHPYSLVKDHRTSVENGNVQAVMDGGINGFMEAFLKKQVETK